MITTHLSPLRYQMRFSRPRTHTRTCAPRALTSAKCEKSQHLLKITTNTRLVITFIFFTTITITTTYSIWTRIQKNRSADHITMSRILAVTGIVTLQLLQLHNSYWRAKDPRPVQYQYQTLVTSYQSPAWSSPATFPPRLNNFFFNLLHLIYIYPSLKYFILLLIAPKWVLFSTNSFLNLVPF